MTASDAIGVPILVGGDRRHPRDEKQVLNQGIVWQPGIGGGDRYTKRHPVPYGEYIPYRGSLIPDTYGQLALVPRDMVSGTSLEPIRSAASGWPTRSASTWPTTTRSAARSPGGQLITVQTSNAMFINTAQIDQQFEISRLRALETGRWVVVAAINGVSGVIAPTARSSSRCRPAAGRARRRRRARTTLTPAVRLGPWPATARPGVPGLARGVRPVTYRRRDATTVRSQRVRMSEVTA